MYPSPRPLGPPPNYTLRRLVAVTALVLVVFLLYSVVSSCAGGDDDGNGLRAGATSTTASTTTAPLQEPPPCDDPEEQSIYSNVEDWQRTIVDPVYALPDDYLPTDLVPASEANYSAEYRIRAIVVDDLNAMRNAILTAGIPEVALIAAYRSIEDQAALFAARETELGLEAAAEGTARAGHSEHHLGTTIDVRLIGETDVDQTFGDTETGKWLEEHSWEYGFVLSYPRGSQDVTCYKYEPWHFRYVGPELAGRIHASGLTLREYLWHWEVTGTEPGASASAVTSTTTGAEDGDVDAGE